MLGLPLVSCLPLILLPWNIKHTEKDKMSYNRSSCLPSRWKGCWNSLAWDVSLQLTSPGTATKEHRAVSRPTILPLASLSPEKLHFYVCLPTATAWHVLLNAAHQICGNCSIISLHDLGLCVSFHHCNFLIKVFPRFIHISHSTCQYRSPLPLYVRDTLLSQGSASVSTRLIPACRMDIMFAC